MDVQFSWTNKRMLLSEQTTLLRKSTLRIYCLDTQHTYFYGYTQMNQSLLPRLSSNCLCTGRDPVSYVIEVILSLDHPSHLYCSNFKKCVGIKFLL